MTTYTFNGKYSGNINLLINMQRYVEVYYFMA